MDGTILVADDDRTIRTVLTQALTRAGCRVHATSSLVTLMRWVEEGKGDLVVSDVMMPDGNGLEMLPQITAKRPNLPVIIISAQNTINTAIQAAEAQAFDYLPKPFDLPDLMKRVGKALAVPRQRRAAELEGAGDPAQGSDLPMVGRTQIMQDLYRRVARVMNADLPVMILGESGTGKSLIARAIHDFSDRRSLPFVTATATDFDDNDSAMSVLSRARSGTLVIDEISDLSDSAQARLVRMMDGLPDHPPRILVTTQKPLPDAMAAGTFREDLFYRISGATLLVPALRDRIDDVPLMVDHFLARADRSGAALPIVRKDAFDMMRNYRWPGNVRQLENLMRQLSVTAGPEGITAEDVTQALKAQPAAAELTLSVQDDRLGASVERHMRRYFDRMGGNLPPPGLYQRILREIEAPLLRLALDATSGNQAKCADLLGINRNTLRKKLNDLDIHVTRGRRLM